MSREFTCEVCRGTFLTDTSEAEMEAEFRARFPGEDYSDVASVCDTCDARMRAWLQEHGGVL